VAAVRTTGSREVYRNPWIRVREDTVEHADGSPGIYGVVEKEHFALVLPYERGGFWVVEEYRLPVGRRVPGFPQGTWTHGATGTPEELARAELAEETGFRAGTLRHLGHLDLAPGLTTQEFDVWLATDLTAGSTDREATEADMTCTFVPEEELRARIRNDRFPDGPSVAGYGLLLLGR
jgi:8-oxo-dGTP pyrophosphatase MutT (NUDIX family)